MAIEHGGIEHGNIGTAQTKPGLQIAKAQSAASKLKIGKTLKRSTGCLSFVLATLFLLFYGVLMPMRRNAQRSQCDNHMRLIGLSIHEYARIHSELPPAYTVNADGTRLQSWRLFVYDIEDYDHDLREFVDFDRPWSIEKNRKFLSTRDTSHSFWCPTTMSPKLSKYVVVVGPNTPWTGPTPTPVSTPIPRNNKILFVEWEPSDIYWAEPRDITVREFLNWFQGNVPGSPHGDTLRYIDWGLNVHELSRDANIQEVRKLLEFPAHKAVSQEEIP